MELLESSLICAHSASLFVSKTEKIKANFQGGLSAIYPIIYFPKFLYHPSHTHQTPYLSPSLSLSFSLSISFSLARSVRSPPPSAASRCSPLPSAVGCCPLTAFRRCSPPLFAVSRCSSLPSAVGCCPLTAFRSTFSRGFSLFLEPVGRPIGLRLPDISPSSFFRRASTAASDWAYVVALPSRSLMPPSSRLCFCPPMLRGSLVSICSSSELWIWWWWNCPNPVRFWFV
ncbi:PREDICTED: uncharacterized protein LOC105965971 [Erythranthe guttata]|uniref:uncharacterized protein LOC105965971 n=1 Tax=Erythranthe guttata TaxID=4155 RepID=UPI00064D98EC|nr:PREDICTED: uncharacterized protein LOC105965971 [Erythranthe guttata]|eukprot:XP_012845968.1 PREDICTED: uncharacterized protein LOC105965971 [Erythranthe guttata]